MEQQQININQPVVGLNIENVDTQVTPGQFTYALNGINESFDGQIITLGNESANELCVTFPEGYKVVGCFSIQSIERVVYMLSNPSTGYSQVGYSDRGECKYNVLLDDSVQKQFNGGTYSSDLLGFHVAHPIHKLHVKTTNCSTQIYWTDNHVPMYYIDFDKLPFKDIVNPDNSFKPLIITDVVDTNKMRVMPHFKVPKVTPIEVPIGGNLVMGTYQFAIAYSNYLGEAYTSYYNVSNPLGVFEQKPGLSFNLPSTKSIDLQISELDTSGLYEYFNIAVVKTINNITTSELIGTFPITGTKYQHTYTGSTKTDIRLDIIEIVQRYPVYETAQGSFVVDNVLGWYGLTADERRNYQLIWNQVVVGWETYKLPYTKEEGYTNGLNTALYKGYMRDEVYPLEGTFVFSDGKESDAFHIPGRKSIQSDLELVPIENMDAAYVKDSCEEVVSKQKWQVYNTATLEGKYITSDDSCYVGPYEYGKTAYWESESTYPNNPVIWGQSDDPNKPYYSTFGLAGKKIRHHKMPDSLITHIHDNNDVGYKEYEHNIFPIGFKIDANSLRTALVQSDIPQSVKDKIVGFKIYRGNRANNKSVIAKGLFNNVGEYTYKNDTYLYPNYPYNDLRKDPFFVKSEPKHHGGTQDNILLEGFDDENISKKKFTFHSPDTHFYQPSISNNGLLLKTETIEHGTSYGKFIELKDNAEYKFSTKDTVATAAALALMITFDSLDGTPKFRAVDGIGAFSNALNVMEKLIPFYNYGAYYSSVGLYNKYTPIKNDGNKQRNIVFSKYISDGINAVDEGKQINNYRRESSLYLSSKDKFLYPHEYDSEKISIDESRYLPESVSTGITFEEYYTLLKGELSSFTYNMTSWTNMIANASMEQCGQDFIDKVDPVLPSFSEVIQSIFLGASLAVHDEQYWDSFMQYNLTANSYFSYVINLIKNLSSFDELVSWSKYETICENYSTLNPPYPSSDDLTLVTIHKFNSAGDPITISKCNAFFKWVAYRAIFSGQGIYNGHKLQQPISTYISTTTTGTTSWTVPYLGNYITLNVVSGSKFVPGYPAQVEGVGQFEILGRTVTTLTLKNVGEATTMSHAGQQVLQQHVKITSNTYPTSTPATPQQSSINTDVAQEILNKEYNAHIASYYGSIKKIFPDQWGNIYSYQIIDTGYFQKLKDENNHNITNFETVFGGDVFINRFAYKSKLSTFTKTTVKTKDGADINLKKEGNLGFPTYWISTEPLGDITGMSASDVQKVFANIGKIDTAQLIADGINSVVHNIPIIGPIIQFAHDLFNIFHKGKKAIEYGRIYLQWMKSVIEDLGTKNINLSYPSTSGLLQRGLIYQYIYGVPYFFVESEVNVDYRQAFNDKEGNFYPNVGSFIPEDWTQEAEVPIAFDNTYTYNQSYSKQNDLFKDVITHLLENYDPTKKCNTNFPNRAIWSDKASQEETKNHWLVYRPLARFDLPKEYGGLTSIDSLENNQLLVRFTNSTQLYNALTTVKVSAGPAAYLGTNALFAGSIPLDVAKTDIGYAGSQNTFLLRTEYGNIFTNAARGQVINIKGGQPNDIGDKGIDKWLSQNMPYNILNYNSNVNIDNYYNGVGMHGVYDALYKRFILTKKDYDVINNCAEYDSEVGWYDKCQGISCPTGYTLINGQCVKYVETEGSPIYSCPTGWTLQGTKCVKNTTTIVTTSPINNSVIYPVTHKTYRTWGWFGAAIFSSTNGQGIGNHIIKNTTFWKTKINEIALWSDTPVVNKWVGFETCVNFPETKTYYIGLAADNIYRFKIDGQIILSLEETNTALNKYTVVSAFGNQLGLALESGGLNGFTYAPWSGAYQVFGIFPITISAGSHKISLEAMDFGNPGMFAAEVYNNTQQDLLNATSNNTLNILFTTKGKTEISAPNYSCPSGYTLTAGASPCDLPQCSKTTQINETIDATVTIPIEEYPVTAPVIHQLIDINDTTYFKDRSWTLSYSFNTQSWISWHSYAPNYYVGFLNYFQSGRNDIESLWNHNLCYTKFNNFYNTQYPYILEYPFVYKTQDEIVQSIKEWCTVRKYINFTEWYEPNETIYFNKTIVYNNQGCSGIRNLVPLDRNNLASYRNKIVFNTDSIDIPVTKKDNNYIYNDIWNVTRDLSQPLFVSTGNFLSEEKTLNQSNMNYNSLIHDRPQLRARTSKIRHVLDNRSDVKILNKFIIEETKTSYS